MVYIYWIAISVILLFLALAIITSLFEREYRAARIFFLILLFSSVAGVAPLVLYQWEELYQTIFLIIFTIGILAFFLPIRGMRTQNTVTYGERFDEAESVLSRRLLKAGTSAYQAYYDKHPEHREQDDRSRSNPGLLAMDAVQADAVTFAAAKAGFSVTETLHELEEVPVNDEKVPLDPDTITTFIRKWVLRSGAHSVGFTPLMDHHLYKRKGRGKKTGMLIECDLDHAIVFTVEMDHDMMRFAPAGPTVLESADQYLSSGVLATKLTQFIKNLGYNARAHIDGNYEVICPLVAADAGLGVIGRIGLLMTPRLGPRVRIAVVTTDIPLSYVPAKSDRSPIDFCHRCRKCAEVCPSAAIPMGRQEIKNNIQRWQVNSERCYNYWTISGTDCGQCVISCPYSHPDNWLHRFMRWGTKNNLLFRIMAAKLDTVFYGKKPKPYRAPLEDQLTQEG